MKFLGTIQADSESTTNHSTGEPFALPEGAELLLQAGDGVAYVALGSKACPARGVRIEAYERLPLRLPPGADTLAAVGRPSRFSAASGCGCNPHPTAVRVFRLAEAPRPAPPPQPTALAVPVVVRRPSWWARAWASLARLFR